MRELGEFKINNIWPVLGFSYVKGLQKKDGSRVYPKKKSSIEIWEGRDNKWLFSQGIAEWKSSTHEYFEIEFISIVVYLLLFNEIPFHWIPAHVFFQLASL